MAYVLEVCFLKELYFSLATMISPYLTKRPFSAQ